MGDGKAEASRGGRQARAYICVRRTVGRAEVVRAAAMSVAMERRSEQSDRSIKGGAEGVEGEGNQTEGKVGDDREGETTGLCRANEPRPPANPTNRGGQPGPLLDGDGRARPSDADMPSSPAVRSRTTRATHATAEVYGPITRYSSLSRVVHVL